MIPWIVRYTIAVCLIENPPSENIMIVRCQLSKLYSILWANILHIFDIYPNILEYIEHMKRRALQYSFYEHDINRWKYALLCLTDFPSRNRQIPFDSQLNAKLAFSPVKVIRNECHCVITLKQNASYLKWSRHQLS